MNEELIQRELLLAGEASSVTLNLVAKTSKRTKSAKILISEHG